MAARIINIPKYFFILACPSPLVRFEDKCYQMVDTEIKDVEDNIDTCSERGASLWTPQTSVAHHFVAQTFFSPNGLYHLGIVKYTVKCRVIVNV